MSMSTRKCIPTAQPNISRTILHVTFDVTSRNVMLITFGQTQLRLDNRIYTVTEVLTNFVKQNLTGVMRRVGNVMRLDHRLYTECDCYE
eukprot:1054465-Amphidinium_carterae.1